VPQVHKNFNFQLPFFGFRYNYTRVCVFKQQIGRCGRYVRVWRQGATSTCPRFWKISDFFAFSTPVVAVALTRYTPVDTTNTTQTMYV
jgi:hypothetical protein